MFASILQIEAKIGDTKIPLNYDLKKGAVKVHLADTQGINLESKATHQAFTDAVLKFHEQCNLPQPKLGEDGQIAMIVDLDIQPTNEILNTSLHATKGEGVPLKDGVEVKTELNINDQNVPVKYNARTNEIIIERVKKYGIDLESVEARQNFMKIVLNHFKAADNLPTLVEDNPPTLMNQELFIQQLHDIAVLTDGTLGSETEVIS